MQTIVTDVRGVCQSVCHECTTWPHVVKPTWDSASLCGVIWCSLCQITLASCYFIYSLFSRMAARVAVKKSWRCGHICKAHRVRWGSRFPCVEGECGEILPLVMYRSIPAWIRCGLRQITLASCYFWLLSMLMNCRLTDDVCVADLVMFSMVLCIRIRELLWKSLSWRWSVTECRPSVFANTSTLCLVLTVMCLSRQKFDVVLYTIHTVHIMYVKFLNGVRQWGTIISWPATMWGLAIVMVCGLRLSVCPFVCL